MMQSPCQTKICGLTTPHHVTTALDAGAAFVGFVTFPKSPRHILPEAAVPLARLAKGRAQTVSVVVDPDADMIAHIRATLAPDFIQLHGQESPQFCAALRRDGTRIIKAFPIAAAHDLDAIAPYVGFMDMILLDAKPPQDAAMPGGHGHAFEWEILRGVDLPVPWFLSGGLRADNVAEALRVTGAKMLDVSSGVETAHGIKDSGLIAGFLTAVSVASHTDA
ncbi:MAG: hypothetical protein RL186_609 [Pseudomonadota bacterium]